MLSLTKDFLNPLVCSPDDSSARPGTSVRLTLTDSIPDLPSPILAVIQNPIQRVNVIHPTTGCAVSGYRYTFLYDETQLEGVVTSIDACDVISVACVTCCELLQENLATETAARIAADTAEATARAAADTAEATARAAADSTEQAARILGDSIGIVAPTNAAPATSSTGTLEDDNLILWFAQEPCSAGNSLTRAIVIDETEDRASLRVVRTGNNIVVTSGDHYAVAAEGDFGDGVEYLSLVFARKLGTNEYYWSSDGKIEGDVGLTYPRYQAALTNDSLSTWEAYIWKLTNPVTISGFTLTGQTSPWLGGMEWADATDFGGAVGVPSVNDSPARAHHVVVAANDVSGLGVHLSFDGGDILTGVIEAEPQANLACGLDTTPAPPFFRVADDQLFVFTPQSGWMGVPVTYVQPD